MNWLQAHSGCAVDIEDPRPGQILLLDIAWALSMQCRFSGHCSAFYSVAQHCVHVAELVTEIDPHYALHALLHDAEEAYLGDWIKPFKDALRAEQCSYPFVIADRFKRAIGERFRLDLCNEPAVVKHADRMMLATEHRDLQAPEPRVRDFATPRVKRITPWPQRYAYGAFIEKYQQITQGNVQTGIASRDTHLDHRQ